MASKRPPVEPLSRPAWERIEAGLFERLEAGEHLDPPREPSQLASSPSLLRPRWRWVAGAALAAAAAAILWLQRPVPEAPGEPIARPAPREIAAPPPPESRIVSTDAPTEAALGDAQLTLAARSDVAVSGSDPEGWLVRLDSGQVECRVGPRRGRPPFVVQAGDTRVSVVGTRFTVIRSGAGASVAVSEGHVQVDSGADHVLLGPGDTWPPPAAPPPAPSPAGSREPAPSAPNQVATRAQQQFERAAALEAKNPRAALSLYRELARGGGPWAQNALYAQARLELELGRPERARPLLRRYLQRYPRGLNAADVEQQLNRLDGAARR